MEGLFSMHGTMGEMHELFDEIQEHFLREPRLQDLEESLFDSDELGLGQPRSRQDRVPVEKGWPQRHKGAAAGEPMSWAQAAEQLRQLGALVHMPDDVEQQQLDWNDMAGYEEQKRLVEDLVLMSIKHAEEYQRVAKKTRKDGKHQRPKVWPITLLWR
jgi:hypothetical protein